MLEVKVDWLEFTMLDAPFRDIFQLLHLPFEDFSQLAKGRFGYHSQLKWKGGHVYVMFTAKNEEVSIDTKVSSQSGIHVMLTGQGCRQYAASHDLLGLIKVLARQDKVNFSRIDLAVDDYESKIISYDRIYKEALAGHFTSRWTKWDEVTSRQTSTNQYLGRTMYFGSQASDLFCRVYDKTLERKANSEATDIPKGWTRLEVVYRKDRAKKLVEHMIIGGKTPGHVLRGTLKQYLRFLKPSTDQNKARWPTSAWWEELLAGVEPLQLTIEKDKKTIDDMRAWVEKQISPTLSAIIKAHEGDLEWLRQTIVKGSKRLSKRHQEAISQYLEGEPA